MRTALNLLTALATLLAIASEAAALGNFAPAGQFVQPQVLRPVLPPVGNVSRLTKKAAAPEPESAGGEDDDKSERRQATGEDGPETRPLPGPGIGPEPLSGRRRAARDAARNSARQAPLPPVGPEGLGEAGPQPEPPTIADGAGGARRGGSLDAGAGGGPHMPDPLAGPYLPDPIREAFPAEEVAAMRDLEAWLAGQDAIDDAGIGGGG